MTAHWVSALLASAAASLVELVEALTVVLAAGAVGGWRPALAGGAGGLAVLAALVGLFGPALTQLPTAPVRTVFGALMVGLGARWLLKATRRAAGVVPLRNEAASFARHRRRLEGAGASGALVALEAVVVEGLEVVLVVLAAGAGGPGLLGAAVLGASLALAAVGGLGLVLRGPIGRVPDNTIKRVVGGVLCGVGTFWVGQGAGLRWPGGEVCAVVLAAMFLAASWAASWAASRAASRAAAGAGRRAGAPPRSRWRGRR